MRSVSVLNEAVLKVAQQNGANSLEAFQQKLDKSAPGSYAFLRNRIAEDLAINRLRQQVVMSRIQISDQDVDNFPLRYACWRIDDLLHALRGNGETSENSILRTKLS